MYATYSFNWGPNHPAAHGVMRLVVLLLSEVVISLDSHFGLLHSGTEKLIEMSGWLQSVGYFDSLDYVSSVSQEEVFICSIELVCCSDWVVLLNSVVILELVSVLNHLLVIGCHLGDIGAISFILWLFEDSESLFELIESLSGVSLHSILFSLFRLSSVWSIELSDDLTLCLSYIVSSIEDCIDVIVGDIMSLSTALVFHLGIDDSCMFGFSGVLLSSVGVSWDISVDCHLYFTSVLYVCYSLVGDSLDSLLLRIGEMNEAVYLVMLVNCVVLLGFECFWFAYGLGFSNWLMFGSMEVVIDCFYFGLMLFMSLFEIGFGFSEVPNGEFINLCLLVDVMMVYSNSISSLGFIYLNSLMYLVNGVIVSDLVTSIGTIDVVFGEVDS